MMRRVMEGILVHCPAVAASLSDDHWKRLCGGGSLPLAECLVRVLTGMGFAVVIHGRAEAVDVVANRRPESKLHNDGRLANGSRPGGSMVEKDGAGLTLMEKEEERLDLVPIQVREALGWAKVAARNWEHGRRMADGGAQRAMSSGGSRQRATGGSGFRQRTTGGCGFGQRATGGCGFGQRAAGGSGSGQRVASGGGFGQGFSGGWRLRATGS
ncbi:hypothetical protein Dimus_021498 [Dionaea muscipula]